MLNHYEMIKRNKNYGNKAVTPRTPKRHMKKSSKEVEEERKQKEELIQRQFFIISIRTATLVQYIDSFHLLFQHYSQKQLIQLFTNIFGESPISVAGDSVNVIVNENQHKPRKIALKGNFLIFQKKEKVLETIIYLVKPMPKLVNLTTIDINSNIVQFENEETCILWINMLKDVRPWFETISRMIVKKNMDKLLFKTECRVPTLEPIQGHERLSPTIVKSTSVAAFSLSPRNIINKLSKSTKLKAPKIFGKSLQQYGDQMNTTQIPVNIRILFEHLNARAIKVDGIFRKSGSKLTIDKIHETLDNKLITREYFTTVDIFSAADSLKLYIRMLAEPLIPSTCNERMVATIKREPKPKDEEIIEEFKNVLKTIPVICYNFLNELYQLLWNIKENVESTQMTEDNLAICIAPNMHIYPIVFNYLLHNYENIFHKD